MSKARFALLVILLAALAAATAGTSAAAAPSSCSARLLADWQDGRIDRTYPVPCYRQALSSLPEDVRVYSTAATDITRALHARLAAPTRNVSAVKTGGGGGGSLSPILVLVIAAALLVTAGSLTIARR
jgi:hypothetical protein